MDMQARFEDCDLRISRASEPRNGDLRSVVDFQLSQWNWTSQGLRCHSSVGITGRNRPSLFSSLRDSTSGPATPSARVEVLLENVQAFSAVSLPVTKSHSVTTTE